MKLPRCTSCVLLTGVLAAAPLELTGQTIGTLPPINRVQPPKAPTIMPGAGAPGSGLGGPAGVLSEPQRASYEAAVNHERGQMTDLQAKLRAARQDFLTSSLNQKFDENIVRQKAFVSARFEAELAVLRAKALSQVRPALTPEQIEKIKGSQPGPIPSPKRPQLERTPQHAPTSGTNQDANGLPPKN
jgi:hypothetical protein